MATAVASPMTAWAPHHHHSMSWSDPMHHYPTHQLLPYMQPIHQSHPPPPPMPRQPSAPTPMPGQSTPWTQEEDNVLMEAKRQGLGWREIHERHFPGKTGNACRKRHERLMNQRRTSDWDEARTQRVIAQYNTSGVRERIWREIADPLGERWDDVEKVCFQRGLRGLRMSRTRHGRQRSRASSGQGVSSEYDDAASNADFEDQDDSGIQMEAPSHSRRSSHMTSAPATSRTPGLDQTLLPGNGYGYR